MAMKRGNAKYMFHLLANAHLDPVWLWDWREGLNEGIVTCRTMVELMEEDRQMVFSRADLPLDKVLREWILDWKSDARPASYDFAGAWLGAPFMNK